MGEPTARWSATRRRASRSRPSSLPGDTVNDMTMLSADEVAVLSITGPDGAQVTTVYTCDLAGTCDRSGTAEGVGVLGGSP
ncbi:hypothetical protein G5V59_18440 [Nocardioides sp. W3-2-3]|nr:hypothetical protein [Nocardioides convexus]